MKSTEKNLTILSAGVSDLSQVDALNLDGRFRRASSNMKLSFLATQACLQDVSESDRAKMPVIFCSSEGELDSTLGFYRAFELEQVARPILFQNSLHHSTVGFLMIQLGLLGPAFTLSQGRNSGQAGIELARILFSTHPFHKILVIGCDVFPESALKDLGVTPWDSGAGAVLLANGEGRDWIPEERAPGYDSDWIERLAVQFLKEKVT